MRNLLSLKTILTKCLSALFHNNCMYLAHNLLTLVHEYEYKLSEILKQHNLTYADQTLMLRKVGVDYFLNHMKIQREFIFDILRKSGIKTFTFTVCSTRASSRFFEKY